LQTSRQGLVPCWTKGARNCTAVTHPVFFAGYQLPFTAGQEKLKKQKQCPFCALLFGLKQQNTGVVIK
jgi:hypothetical protein